MTVLNPEIKQPEQSTTNKVEVNTPQNTTETNVTQQKIDNPEQNQTKEESVEDPNWRAFREARKKDRADKEAAERLKRQWKQRFQTNHLPHKHISSIME
jgi:hypothetical protein